MPPSAERDLDAGELVEHLGEQQIGERRLAVRAHQRDPHGHRTVEARHRHLTRRSEMHRDRHFALVDGGPEGIPVVGVKRRQAERDRVFGEGHRAAALGGGAAHLSRRQLGIVERHEHARDQPFRGRRTPFVERPVVVGLDALEGEGAILPLEEDRPREPWERREVEAGLDTVEVHVQHAGDRVVTPGEHVVVARRVEPPLRTVLAGDGVESDVRKHLPLVQPHVSRGLALR